MLSRARAVSSHRLRQRNPFDAEVTRIPGRTPRDLHYAFAARESAVAPRDPADLFKSAAVQALSQRVAERHFPTDRSFERGQAAANASASLTELTNSTARPHR